MKTPRKSASSGTWRNFIAYGNRSYRSSRSKSANKRPYVQRAKTRRRRYKRSSRGRARRRNVYNVSKLYPPLSPEARKLVFRSARFCEYYGAQEDPNKKQDFLAWIARNTLFRALDGISSVMCGAPYGKYQDLSDEDKSRCRDIYFYAKVNGLHHVCDQLTPGVQLRDKLERKEHRKAQLEAIKSKLAESAFDARTKTTAAMHNLAESVGIVFTDSMAMQSEIDGESRSHFGSGTPAAKRAAPYESSIFNRTAGSLSVGQLGSNSISSAVL